MSTPTAATEPVVDRLATEPGDGLATTTGAGVAAGSRAVLWLALPLAITAALCFLAPLLPLPDPNEQNLRNTLQPPVFAGGDWSHPLGTDKLGRDMLARLLHGGQLTFIIGVAGALVAVVPGALIGLAAGFARGKVDAVVSQLISAQLALPFVLIALPIIIARGQSIWVLLLVLGLTGWAPVARVVRAEAMSVRERQFILGLRAVGASGARIMFRHVLPNLAAVLVVLGTLQVGTAILIESALSFLGMGVVEPDMSWGSILASGQDILKQGWWVSTIPGIAITAVVLLVNLLGDALLVRYDPRKRQY